MNLRTVAAKGFLWTFLDTLLSKGIAIIASILLARLLSPREFGLLGMIYVFTSISQSLVDGGLTSSLIRSDDTTSLDYATIFYTNLGIGFLLYALLFITAPLIAGFYGEPDLIMVIRVYTLIIVINSFSAVQRALFTKKLAFKKLMYLNIPGIIIGSIVGILMAFYSYGVWSIVAMQLVTQIVFNICLWIFSDWSPKFEFSKSRLAKHFDFGYKLTISGVINAVYDNIYNIIIGKFYTTELLGQMDRAKVYNNYPMHILSAMITKVTYPLLSTIKNERERLVQSYREILQVTTFISIPLMLVLSIIATPLFVLVLGEQWREAASFFKILCFAGMLYPILSFNLNLLKVLGRSDLFLKIEIIKKSIATGIILIAINFDIYVLVWSAVVIAVMELVINTHYTKKLVNYNLTSQISDVSITLITGAAMYVILFYLNTITNFNGNLVLQILVPAAIGLLLFFGFNFIFRNPVVNLIRGK